MLSLYGNCIVCSMLRRASTDSWWTPADALHITLSSNHCFLCVLCSDLHQHLLPGYNTSSTYPPYFTYIQSRPSERLLILSSPSSSSSPTFLQVFFCIVTYLLPSSFSFVGEKDTEAERGSLQHIQRSKRTQYLHRIWTICIFLRSVDSLWILFFLIVWLNMHLRLLVTPL